MLVGGRLMMLLHTADFLFRVMHTWWEVPSNARPYGVPLVTCSS